MCNQKQNRSVSVARTTNPLRIDVAAMNIYSNPFRLIASLKCKIVNLHSLEDGWNGSGSRLIGGRRDRPPATASSVCFWCSPGKLSLQFAWIIIRFRHFPGDHPSFLHPLRKSSRRWCSRGRLPPRICILNWENAHWSMAV